METCVPNVPTQPNTHTGHLRALAVNSLATPQRAEAGAYVTVMVFLVSPATQRLPGSMSLGQMGCMLVFLEAEWGGQTCCYANLFLHKRKGVSAEIL